MLYSFKELRNKYTYGEIEKLLEENKIYKIEKGIYSDNKNVNYLELINFKYPNAVFTLDSAFYLLADLDMNVMVKRFLT